MNLWLRLFCYVLTSWRRPALDAAEAVSVLHFRAWPLDLDTSLHVNNGRYLQLMDLGRVDLIVRTGLWRVVRRNGWTPIASAIAIRYRRELRPFARFRLETRIVYFAQASVIMEQTFVLTSGPYAGQVSARSLVKAGIYSRRERTFIDTQRLMAEIGVTTVSPPMTTEIEAFLKADGALKVSAVGYGDTANPA